MKYYKIIVNNTLIGAINSGAFLEENPHSHKLLISTENEGQFVDYYGILYRDYWMRPLLNNTTRTFTLAVIEEITLETYNTLIEAIENHKLIIIDDDQEDPIVIPENLEDPDLVLAFVREAKINQMSQVCHRTIESGFDLILRGETYHFSLTTQDQLNLMNLSIMAQTENLIPYHADGEECVFYGADEINQISSAANTFKNYQLAYYNALKAYINDLDTIEAIAAIEYGTPIPDEYKSDVLMVLE